jgi:flagellar biosynthetic protein FlhB
MDQGSQDKNLPATERKLQKARDEGQVTRSEDLKHLAVLAVGSMSLLTLSPLMFDQLQQSLVRHLTFDRVTVQQTSSMLNRLGDATAIGVGGSILFALIMIIAAVLASLAVGGWVASLKAVEPKFSKINPLTGFMNMFSKKKLISVGKTMLMTMILFAIAAQYLNSSMESVAILILQPSGSAFAKLTQWMTTGLGLMILVVMFAALIDVPLQKFLFAEEMKMSHQEMKEEGKQSEGNPQIKGKIKQKQREIAQRNSIKAVPKADFVVMNPTHFAVAILYDENTMGAPQVISKGADLIAMKIRDVAKQNDVPVLQSPMLARALYANAELNQDIPSALFLAVAQVLAYIYQLRAALRGQGPMPQHVPQPHIPPELDPLSKSIAVSSP